MVKHHHEGKEWWCLPGGGVEKDETPAEAVLRELKEECGVEGDALERCGAGQLDGRSGLTGRVQHAAEALKEPRILHGHV